MKKQNQLKMNPSTASGRLVKDILFDFVSKSGAVCFRCGKSMTRDDFSIDHKIAWLDSESPIDLFFDLENIAYSHKFCNISAGRKPSKKDPNTAVDRKNASNRKYWNSFSKEERVKIRREKYEKYGV